MKVLLASAVAIVAFGLAGCVMDAASSPRRPNIAAASTSVGVPADSTTKIDQFSFITPGCSEVAGISARVTKRAGYGTVSIRRGRDFSPYPAGNSSAACNSRRVPVWVVLYSPAPGYQGDDLFAYRKSFPDGRSVNVIVNVDVR